MKTTFRSVSLLLSVLFFCLSSARADTLDIAAIDWCPQLCPDSETRGYIFDIVDKVYEDSGYQLNVKFYPWSRAIALVSSGRVHGLLSPTKSETPDLLFPNGELGMQEICFFASSGSTWNYDGLDSLSGLKVGLFSDGFYGEIEPYIALNKRQFQYMSPDENFISSNLKKIGAGRIDTFLYTKSSTQYELSIMGLEDNYRTAGCITEDKLYIAFSPEHRDANQIQSMMTHFDQKMIELKKNGSIADIMGNYGLDYWGAATP